MTAKCCLATMLLSTMAVACAPQKETATKRDIGISPSDANSRKALNHDDKIDTDIKSQFNRKMNEGPNNKVYPSLNPAATALGKPAGKK